MSKIIKLEQSCHCVLAVLARTPVHEFVAEHAGQIESVMEFAVGKKISWDLTLEPWNSRLRLRSKSSHKGKFSDA